MVRTGENDRIGWNVTKEVLWDTFNVIYRHVPYNIDGANMILPLSVV